MPPSLQAAISAIPFFASLPAAKQEELMRFCSMRSYKANDYVFLYGDVGDALYLVAEGEVEVFTHNNAGQEIALEMIDAGGVFGEVALFNGETRTANVKARMETVLVRIESGSVSAALSLCPELRDALLRGMAKRLRTSGDNLRRLTTFDINKMKQEPLTAFDRVSARIVDVLAGVPFLVVLMIGSVFWLLYKPFHDTGYSYLSLIFGVLSVLITLLVLLSQHRQEKSASVVDAEESLAIRQAAKELQYLHRKLDSMFSKAELLRQRESDDR